MPTRDLPSDPLSAERVRTHYLIEKDLASRLRAASKTQRAKLYSSLYDELFRRVPYHPQLLAKQNWESRLRAVRRSMRLFEDRLSRDSVFIEIGPGDCALSCEVAKRVRKVFALDVSEEIVARSLPTNVSIVLSDGSSVDLPAESADVAYSNQLMEHLHPDDAREQLVGIHAALKPRGRYYCITPNRLTGPHDVSSYFDEVATGFHLKEYSNEELIDLFKRAGFRRTLLFVGKQGLYVRCPALLKVWTERLLLRTPERVRRKLARFFPVRLLLRIIIVGEK